VGHAPPPPTGPGLDVVSTERQASYEVQHVTYLGAAGDQVTASLLTPLESTGPGKAVLALHQSCPHGRFEPMGLAGHADLAYAHELATRGYVVLAPDEFVAGERAGSRDALQEGGLLDAGVTARFEGTFPQWSAAGRMIGDHMQAVTVLQQLPGVDPDKVGVIGHSLGGLNAWWLLSVDPRPRVAVVSCGFSPLDGDPWPQRWAAPGYFHYFHRLDGLLAAGETPFEFHEVLALVAPRPLFLWVAEGDEQFPHVQAIVSATQRVREVYQLLGHGDRFAVRVGAGPHGFPRSVRDEAYRFLDAQLG